jgi:PadR family transcriptional regulator, regulatory protein PadR
MPARKQEDGIVPPLGLPRNLLVPYVLLFLKNWSAHGYQILQTLTLLGFAAVDPATVYRALRQMEKEGLVLSSWETGASGPARRTYRITEAGEQFLSQWADALGAYQRFLDRFFQLYAGKDATTPPAADGAGTTGDDGVTGPRKSGRAK